jgi:2,4-dienoyl-CoA reductase-like NADH-dependent reductase (Old Yellow Enzyme family)
MPDALTRLFEPGQIGRLEIKNRIVMAPMLTWGLVESAGMISPRASPITPSAPEAAPA